MQRVESEPARAGSRRLIDTRFTLSSPRVARQRPLRKAVSGDFRRHGQSQPVHKYGTGAPVGRRADAQIYTIAVVSAVSPIQPPKPLIMTEGQRGQHFLEELAARTGGMSFVPATRRPSSRPPRHWPGAAESIHHRVRALRQRRRPNGARFRSRVAGSGLRVYARAGYRGD